MPKKPKIVILKHGEMMAAHQRAELDVIDERKRLAIGEANAHAGIRAACLERVATTANVTMQDIFETTAAGNVVPRKISDLPREVARAIRKMKVWTTTTEKDGVKTTVQATEIELAHHLGYEELIGKYVGLWSDKHLHLHADVAPEGSKLSDLTGDQLAARRSVLEKQVEALNVRTTPKEK